MKKQISISFSTDPREQLIHENLTSLEYGFAKKLIIALLDANFNFENSELFKSQVYDFLKTRKTHKSLNNTENIVYNNVSSLNIPKKSEEHNVKKQKKDKTSDSNVESLGI